VDELLTRRGAMTWTASRLTQGEGATEGGDDVDSLSTRKGGSDGGGAMTWTASRLGREAATEGKDDVDELLTRRGAMTWTASRLTQGEGATEGGDDASECCL
jgi:hypothetical protein